MLFECGVLGIVQVMAAVGVKKKKITGAKDNQPDGARDFCFSAPILA
jgi:hypothetical protein